MTKHQIECLKEYRKNGQTCRSRLQKCLTEMNWDCPFIEAAWRIYAWHTACMPPIFLVFQLLVSSKLRQFRITNPRVHGLDYVLFHYLKNM